MVLQGQDWECLVVGGVLCEQLVHPAGEGLQQLLEMVEQESVSEPWRHREQEPGQECLTEEQLKGGLEQQLEQLP